MITLLDIARKYLEYGWSVIPFSRAGKQPIIPWQQYQHRRAGILEITEWFTRWPDANIGIVTGNISHLIVLDIDPQHGGHQSLATLEKQYSRLPPTVEVETGGGGRHLYFSHPGGLVRNKVAMLPGIDLRADGGCVVAPPSIHTSGKRYKWATQHEPDHMPLAPLPDWFLNVANIQRKTSHSLEHWKKLVKEGIVEGERNNTIASLSGYLLWHGIHQDIVAELLLCWNRERCQPPLSDEEVIRTVESITHIHGQK